MTNYWDEEAESFSYLAPYMKCRNWKCAQYIALPYGLLPQLEDQEEESELEDEDQPMTPPDGWSKVFACIECGHVAVYDDSQVFVNVVLHQTRGKYHDDATLFAVRFSCANIRCKAPCVVHVDT